MSDSKNLFESAPDAKNAFSNAAQEQNEIQENIPHDITEGESTLEYKPPTPEFGFENSQSIEMSPDVRGRLDAQKENLSENKSKENQHGTDHFLSNPIQTNVSLNEDWDEVRSPDTILDEGAEQ